MDGTVLCDVIDFYGIHGCFVSFFPYAIESIKFDDSRLLFPSNLQPGHCPRPPGLRGLLFRATHKETRMRGRPPVFTLRLWHPLVSWRAVANYYQRNMRSFYFRTWRGPAWLARRLNQWHLLRVVRDIIWQLLWPALICAALAVVIESPEGRALLSGVLLESLLACLRLAAAW